MAYPTVGALIASRLPKRGGAPVTMWVEGREYQGTADAITDHAEVTRVLGRFLEAGNLGSKTAISVHLYGPRIGELDGRDYDPSRDYVCDRTEP